MFAVKRREKLHLGAGEEWPYPVPRAFGSCSPQAGHLPPGGGCERFFGDAVKTLGLCLNADGFAVWTAFKLSCATGNMESYPWN